MVTRVSSDALHCFKIYGDGFCIVESIRRCLRHVGCDVDRQTLLDGISNEVLYKLDYYRKFMSMEEMDPVAEIVSYVEKGVFQSDIGDMVLHVVANLLHIRINILEYCPMTDEYFLPHEHYVISPVDTISELPVDPKYTVMLKKDGNHYDGLVFKEVDEKMSERKHSKQDQHEENMDEDPTRNFKTLQDLELNLYSYIPVLKTVAEKPAVENPFISNLKVTRWDKVRIILLCFLIPFRMIILGSSIIVACAIAKLFLVGYVEVDPLIPFRGLRKLGQDFMYILCRICAFSCGFHDIKIKGALSPEARIIVAAPHSSFIDIFATMLVGHHTAVTRTENVKSYFIGNCIRLMQPTAVHREAKDSKIYGIKEIKRRANTQEWPPTLIFPEGTCTNRESLIFFKPGAFYPGLPVQPMILRYKDEMDYASWTVIGRNALSLLCLMMTRLNNKMELEILPVYKPSQEEINDPFLYARNVREQVAKVDNTPITDHSYEDCRLMHEAEKLKMPMETGLVEYYKLNRLIGINCDYMMEQLHKFSKIDLNLDGLIDLDEFCDYLNLPATEEVQTLFRLYDIHKNNKITFRHFLIGQFLIAKPYCTDENIYEIFNTVFCPEDQQECLSIQENGRKYPSEQGKTLSIEKFLLVMKEKMDVYDDCVQDLFGDISSSGRNASVGDNSGTSGCSSTKPVTNSIDYKQFKDYCTSKPELVLLFLHMRNTEKIRADSFDEQRVELD